MANAATDADRVPPSFPDVLRQLTRLEAALIEAIYEASEAKGVGLAVEIAPLAEARGIDGGRLPIALDNLYRSRLCRPLLATVPGKIPRIRALLS